MNIESTLTRRQYVKLSLAMIIRRFGFFFAITFFLVFFVLGLLIEDRIMVILAVGYMVFVLLFYVISILIMVTSKKNKNFFLQGKYTFDEENVVITTPISEDVMKWEAFIGWKKMAGFYVLYLSSATFLAIPKSHIPASEISAFEDLLSKKMGAKKQRKWNWKMRIVLALSIILSLVWLLIIFVARTPPAVGILREISGVSFVLLLAFPVIALITAFFMISFGKTTRLKIMIKVSTVLLCVIAVGMLIVLLDLVVFKNFMY